MGDCAADQPIVDVGGGRCILKLDQKSKIAARCAACCVCVLCCCAALCAATARFATRRCILKLNQKSKVKVPAPLAALLVPFSLYLSIFCRLYCARCAACCVVF